MKKTLLWFLPFFLVTAIVVWVFSAIYQNTQKLKSQTETPLYPDIDLKVIPSVSKAMEKMAVPSSPKTLTSAEMTQREEEMKSLALKFPTAHALYKSQCLACHGSVAQGGTILKSFRTRMNHRDSAWLVAPLRSGSISQDIEAFFTAASKAHSPHLPRTLLTSDKTEVVALQAYLKELTDGQ